MTDQPTPMTLEELQILVVGRLYALDMLAGVLIARTGDAVDVVDEAFDDFATFGASLFKNRPASDHAVLRRQIDIAAATLDDWRERATIPGRVTGGRAPRTPAAGLEDVERRLRATMEGHLRRMADALADRMKGDADRSAALSAETDRSDARIYALEFLVTELVRRSEGAAGILSDAESGLTDLEAHLLKTFGPGKSDDVLRRVAAVRRSLDMVNSRLR